MKAVRIACLLFLLVPFCPAQMTSDQKVADFNQLVALYDKNYGPYDWKRTTFGFDLLNTGPWLSRISASKDDLEFYEICIEYVASLMDAHDVFTLPSDFTASLGFTVDVYGGKVLIDSITTSQLPPAQYSFQVGAELVSVDGTSASDLLQAYAKYSIAANPDSTNRNAASRIVSRSQSYMPYAAQIGATAAVVVRRQNGNLQTYQIPWTKSGTPLTIVGPVPTPHSSGAKPARLAPAGEAEPGYMQALRTVQYAMLKDGFVAVRNFGSRTPIFGMPQGFVQRLGNSSSDVFYSGTFTSGGYKIGFIRIPSFSPANTTTAVSQFQAEIAYFQSNTDGLIVDDMRNPGGSICYGEQLESYLMTAPFRVLGYQLRATMSWIESFSYSLTAAQNSNAAQSVIDLYTALLADVEGAYAANRGNTDPIPLCGTSLLTSPATDRTGKIVAYTKPVMLLTDNFSASAADAFAAMFQDNTRGPIFGTRTMGAGGNVVDFSATNYSEAFTRVTESLMVRKYPVVTPDYPTAPYVENIGVRPDIAVDYMTLDNLLNNGRTFVAAFTGAMVDLIEKSQSQQQ